MVPILCLSAGAAGATAEAAGDAEAVAGAGVA